MAFEKNSQALFGLGGEEPVIQKGTKASKTKLDEAADIRDILSGMVSRGVTDFSDQDTKNYFSALSGIIGRQEAQQLMTHIFIFNQRDDVKNKNLEGRVRQFYEMGSNAPNLDNIIKGAGSLGYGYMEALRTSPDILSMQATKRKISQKEGSPEMAEKIKSIASTTVKNQ